MVTIIKGNFKGEKKKSAKGTFLLAFNGKDDILSSDVLVTNDVIVDLPPITDKYDKFNESLKDFASNYLINSTLTLPLREKIKDRFDKETIKKVKQLPKEELHSIINSWIGEVVKEKINIQIEKEEIPEKDYERLTKKEIAPPREISKLPPLLPAVEKEEKKEEYEEIDIYLKAQLAVDEKRGKQVTELFKGDKMLVKIIDERRSGEYLARLLGGRTNSTLIPIVAAAEAAKEEEKDRYRIIVKFGPGIFGEAVIPKEAKIKVLTEQEVEEMVKEKEKEEKRLPLFSGITLTPIVLIEVIIFILLLALAGWWGIVK